MSQYELTEDNLENHPRPSIDLDRWQKELTRIGGLNYYNEPRIKLVWCPEVERLAYGHRRKQFLAATVKRMIYWLESKADGTRVKHPPARIGPDVDISSILTPVYDAYDVSKQRWAIVEWWAPELIAADWEANRYVWEKGIRRDVLGPVPSEGQYRPVSILQTPEGFYREPNESDLEEIRHLAYMRELEPKKFDNNEAQYDPKAIAALAAELGAPQVKAKKELDSNLKESLKENIAPHVDKLIKNSKAVW